MIRVQYRVICTITFHAHGCQHMLESRPAHDLPIDCRRLFVSVLCRGQSPDSSCPTRPLEQPSSGRSTSYLRTPPSAAAASHRCMCQCVANSMKQCVVGPPFAALVEHTTRWHPVCRSLALGLQLDGISQSCVTCGDPYQP